MYLKFILAGSLIKLPGLQLIHYTIANNPFFSLLPLSPPKYSIEIKLSLSFVSKCLDNPPIPASFFGVLEDIEHNYRRLLRYFVRYGLAGVQ